MDTQTPIKSSGLNAAPGSRTYAVESEPEPASWMSPGFIVFAVVVIGAAAIGGAMKSGELNLNHFFNVPKPAAQAQAQVHAAAPVAPLKAGAFVVTSISLGQPSIAIINGTSHAEGDPIEAPGVTGWKVMRIGDGTVWVQNGSTVAALPLTLPGIKPLDDELHPLN